MAQAKKTTKTTAAKTTKATEEKVAPAAKTTAAKAAPVKAAEPVVEVKAETKPAAAEVKTEAKAEAKPAVKTPTKKTAAKKAVETKTELYVEFGGQQVFTDKVAEDVKKTYAAQGGTDEIKTLKIYLKPEESAAYFVVNDTTEGRMDVFFS